MTSIKRKSEIRQNEWKKKMKYRSVFWLNADGNALKYKTRARTKNKNKKLYLISNQFNRSCLCNLLDHSDCRIPYASWMWTSLPVTLSQTRKHFQCSSECECGCDGVKESEKNIEMKNFKYENTEIESISAASFHVTIFSFICFLSIRIAKNCY